MNYQEKLENVINELIENAFDYCDSLGIVEAYGVIENCENYDKTYQEIGRLLDINRNNIDKIDTENKDLLEITEYLLEEYYQAYENGEFIGFESAEQLVIELSIDRPEYDFINDYYDCIDFEAVVEKMFRYDNCISIFENNYYLVNR